MLRILHDTKYDFIRWWRWAAGLTVAFIVLGLFTVFFKGGFRESIEFTGGTQMQLQFKTAPDVSRLRAVIAGPGGFKDAEITQFGSPRDFTVKAQDVGGTAGLEAVRKKMTQVLTDAMGQDAFTVVRAEAIGPRVGSELRRGAFIAVFFSFGVTLLYLAWRFEWRFGLAAVIATMHDILTTVAFMKMLDLEISLTVIAAVLTVIGYSLNDTIIIFDRVRENLRRNRREPMYDTLNRSVNETLPRSVLTHATTLAATLALLIFAGEVIRPFAWVMAFGIFTGTFSSIYVASPILLWIEQKYPRAIDGKGARVTASKVPTAPLGKPPAKPPTKVAASRP